MRRVSALLCLVLGVALGLATGAAAEDQPAADTLAIDEKAVDAAILDEQAVGAPTAVDSSSNLAGVPTATRPAGFDQPSVLSSQAGITTGPVSSSSLQATVSGGSVSLD